MASLTDTQIKRQDFVDNAIYELLQILNPTGNGIDWDIEIISDVRDKIQYCLVEHYKLTDEMTFYPYIIAE